MDTEFTTSTELVNGEQDTSVDTAKILFIGGSINQTSMLYQIAEHLREFDCYFTPFYCDGPIGMMADAGLLDYTILAGRHREGTLSFLEQKDAQVDLEGSSNNYDLVLIGTDLIIPKNVIDNKIVLVQEGIMMPENLAYYLVRYMGFPRFIANTSATGLSDAYASFCVASEGYRKAFIEKGVDPDKIEVTGIPNFDDLQRHENNDFPHWDYVLVATTSRRESFQYENRKALIDRALDIADGKQLIFKLHPSENWQRARREIERWAPGSIVYEEGDINPMVANCDAMVTTFSSVIFNALAMGKDVYCDYDLSELTELTPIQNGGTSARNIADVCRAHLT